MSIFHTKYRSLKGELREQIVDIDLKLKSAKQPELVGLHLRKASVDGQLASLENQLVVWREEEERLQKIFARVQLELTSIGPMNQVKYKKALEAEPGLTEAYTLHQCKVPKL